MMRVVAWLFLIIGFVLVAYNGYQWWDQLNLVVHDPELAKSIADNWDDRTPQKPLDEVESAGKTEKLEVGDTIGELVIPRIGGILPIVEGTDPDSLEKGVGKYVGYGTVAPNQTGHVVLSGHRDTVFRKVGELEEGDRLYIRFQGKIYTYQIRKTWITHAQDRSVIVPKKTPVLTLTTCYPFDYVGDAPDRYIIESELIEVKEDKEEENEKASMEATISFG